MTDHDVYLDDMGFLIDTAALDRVLAGEALPSDASIAAFVEALRDEFPSPEVRTELEDRHVRAIVAAASEPLLAAVAPAPSRLDRLRSSLAARAAALSLATGSAFTGAAYAGVLPDPVQGVVSDTAAQVGVDLPHPDDGSIDRDLPQGEDGLAEERRREAGSDEGRDGELDGTETSTGAVDRPAGRGGRAGETVADDEDPRDVDGSDEAEETVDRERPDAEEDSEDPAGSDDSDDLPDPEDADDDDRSGSSDEDGESEGADDELEDADDDAVSEAEGSDDVDLELDEAEESSDLDD